MKKKEIPQSAKPYDADAAITRGMIAGIPRDCERVSEDVSDILRKCGVIAVKGKLSEAQVGLVKRMQRFADLALAELQSLRETAELLAEHGEASGK